jgi:hypothetical protein
MKPTKPGDYIRPWGSEWILLEGPPRYTRAYGGRWAYRFAYGTGFISVRDPLETLHVPDPRETPLRDATDLQIVDEARRRALRTIMDAQSRETTNALMRATGRELERELYSRISSL